MRLFAMRNISMPNISMPIPGPPVRGSSGSTPDRCRPQPRVRMAALPYTRLNEWESQHGAVLD